MKCFASVFVVLVGLLSSIPHADANEEKTALASKLLELTDYQRQMKLFSKNFLTQTLPASLARIKKANPDITDDKLTQLEDMFYEINALKLEEMSRELFQLGVNYYADGFSKPELEQLIAFYSSAVYRKQLAGMENMMQQGMAIGQRSDQAWMPVIRQRFEEIMKQP